MPEKRISIELIFSGDADLADVERRLDKLLDAGAIQDLINSEIDLDVEIVSASCLDLGEPDYEES